MAQPKDWRRDYLTTRQVREVYGRGRTWLYDKQRAGLLTVYKQPANLNQSYWKVSELEAIVGKHSQPIAASDLNKLRNRETD